MPVPLPEKTNLTLLLNRMFEGDQAAGNEAMDAMYASLRSVAHGKLRGERRDHLLDTTSLVNEAMMRLFNTRQVTVQNRRHFFALACLLMRRVLIDWGRRNDPTCVSLEESLFGVEGPNREVVLSISRALESLERDDPLAYKAFQLKIGAGGTTREVADAMGCSTGSANRYLKRARLWLHRVLLPLVQA